MDGKAPEVDGRFFVASLPYTQEMWIAWGLGALFYLETTRRSDTGSVTRLYER